MNGEDSKLDVFLRKGEIGQAAQLALSVMASAREKTECGQSLPSDVQNQVSCVLWE